MASRLPHCIFVLTTSVVLLAPACNLGGGSDAGGSIDVAGSGGRGGSGGSGGGAGAGIVTDGGGDAPFGGGGSGGGDAPFGGGGSGGGDAGVSGRDGSVLVIPPATPTVSEEFEVLPTAGTTWVPLQAAGGDFARFARVAGGQLAIDVPAGNSWGKTGVRSKDAVFEVTADMETSPWTLLVELDPAATDGFVIALSTAVEDDIWRRENLWVPWIRHPLAGGTSAGISNTQNAGDTSRSLTNTPLAAPATVAVTARPGHAQVCSSSGWAMEGSFAWLKAGAKVHAYVFAHPYDANLPVKLAIKSIRVVRGAACGPKGAIPAYTALPERAVFADDLSAGTDLNWTPLQAAGGDFARFATRVGGELLVDVPANSSWGKTGLRSDYFFFDVRDDMQATPLSLAFDFDPARTSGFVIALSPTVDDDIWLRENVWAAWVRHPTAAGAAAVLDNTQSTTDSNLSLPNIPSESPSTVSLAVRPGHVQMCTSSGWGMEGDYAWLKPGAKVHAYVFSHPYDANMPVKMALTAIRADRTAACGASGAVPAYSAPAPRVLFQDSFAGGYAQNWVGIAAAGGDFAGFAKVTRNELYIDVPANNSWGKTGVRSNYYLFDVRSDYGSAPLELELAFDPARTTGFVIALSPTVDDDIWLRANVWNHFIVDPETGLASFGIENTQNTADTAVARTGLPGTVPGKVTLTIGPKHVKSALPSGVSVEGTYDWLAPDTKVYLYVFNHPARAQLPSSMALKSVTARR